MKKMLTLSATLAFPKEGATMYLLADAFDVGWRVVVIQVVECQPGKELYEQTHPAATSAATLYPLDDPDSIWLSFTVIFEVQRQRAECRPAIAVGDIEKGWFIKDKVCLPEKLMTSYSGSSSWRIVDPKATVDVMQC
ncbi:hypothetical protein PInf_026907 [Phytophthora infestans]|nr:hypothetical protein PInf_026907 [Phytophthora infestans]